MTVVIFSKEKKKNYFIHVLRINILIFCHFCVQEAASTVMCMRVFGSDTIQLLLSKRSRYSYSLSTSISHKQQQ